MPRVWWCRDEIYDFFDTWRRSCLIGDGALFSEEPVWTEANLRELQTTLGTEVEGAGTFFGKLRLQLAPQAPPVRQLGLEIAFIEYLGERDTSADTKRTNLGTVTDLLPEGARLPDALDEILDGGIASYGPGKSYRDFYVRFLMRLALAAKLEVTANGPAALEDPWMFRAIVSQVRTSTDGLQANAVLHACFPDEFDVMISEGHRAKLRRAFESVPPVAAEPDDDRKLLEIRRALLERMPAPVDNPYDDAIRAIWEDKAAAEWRAVITPALAALEEMPHHDPVSAAPPAVDADLLEQLRSAIGSTADGLEWDDLLTQAAARLMTHGADVRAWEAIIEALRAALTELPAGEADQDLVTPEVVLPIVTTQLATELLLPPTWLQDTIDLLGRRRQLIFYGPPGTGKTYLAKRLARHLGNSDAVRLIQFHPSYSYEDFVEGYRPFTADGNLSYRLVKGPLRELAERAVAHPTEPHVLLIDEINRGNMAKIFGELYFLLEYREEPLRLQYSSDEEFLLPANLFLVGTMNTADRSIAMLDAALRRRFSFVELSPHTEPVEGLLQRWLERHGLQPEPAVLLDTLNALLVEADGDTDMAVGPSYFMNRHHTDPDLETVWRYDLLPLLEERFHGTGRNVSKEFGFAAVQAEVARRADVQAVAPPDPTPGS